MLRYVLMMAFGDDCAWYSLPRMGRIAYPLLYVHLFLESGWESIAYPVYHMGRMAIDWIGIGVRLHVMA